MAEHDIIAHIDELIAEEHRLRAQSADAGATEEIGTRLRQVEQRLDQCWDLLRQRRAKAEFNQDPDDAKARPIHEVESYRQ